MVISFHIFEMLVFPWSCDSVFFVKSLSLQVFVQKRSLHVFNKHRIIWSCKFVMKTYILKMLLESSSLSVLCKEFSLGCSWFFSVIYYTCTFLRANNIPCIELRSLLFISVCYSFILFWMLCYIACSIISTITSFLLPSVYHLILFSFSNSVPTSAADLTGA